MIPATFQFLYRNKHIISGVVLGGATTFAPLIGLTMIGNEVSFKDFIPIVTNACVGFYFGKKSIETISSTSQSWTTFSEARAQFRANPTNASWPYQIQRQLSRVSLKQGVFVGGVAGIIGHWVLTMVAVFGTAISGGGDEQKRAILFRGLSTLLFLQFIVGGCALGSIGGYTLSRFASSRMLWG
jgi:hypothetical protein